MASWEIFHQGLGKGESYPYRVGNRNQHRGVGQPAVPLEQHLPFLQDNENAPAFLCIFSPPQII